MIFSKYHTTQAVRFSKLRLLNLAYNPIDLQSEESKGIFSSFIELALSRLNLEYLNVSGIKLEGSVAEKLFEALNSNRSVETLKAKNCNLQSIYALNTHKINL